MPKPCIFCPNKADSQEHIWSEWILDSLPEAKDGKFTRQIGSREPKTHSAKKPVQTVGLVCTPCNTGWMSERLEVPMSGLTKNIILEHNPKIFSAADCKAMANWAFKSALLANHIALANEEPFFSESERYKFAENLTLPVGVCVWLGRRNAGHLTAAWSSVTDTHQPWFEMTPHLTTIPDSRRRFRVNTCTMVVGYLLLQVAALRWARRDVASYLNAVSIVQDKRLNDYSVPIWPNNGFSVSWPPKGAIGNNSFRDYQKRFGVGFRFGE